MAIYIRRREVIFTLCGMAVAWPLGGRAQQPERTRRIGVLMGTAERDPEAQANIAAFLQGLQQLGWTDGRNVRLDYRWGAGNADNGRKYAAELVALAPDIILVGGSSSVGPLLQATRTVPIVFVNVTDPVGSGFVASLARPGGNTTGFIAFEYGIAAKWLELLKEIAPHVTRAAVLRDPTFAAGIGQFAAIQTVAPIGMELSVIGLHDPGAIEQAVATFARDANSGLVVTASPFGANHPDVIVTLAARYKLPTVYPTRYFVSAGGLISYGPNSLGNYRPAADYVDRILKGDKPADLPVVQSTKLELVINHETARILDLTVPDKLLAIADEVIE
jgi:putative tryptophan/tyrosine transport system substrate-binding protein